MIKSGVWLNPSYTKWSWADWRTHSNASIDSVCVEDNISLLKDGINISIRTISTPMIIIYSFQRRVLLVPFENEKKNDGTLNHTLLRKKVSKLSTMIIYGENGNKNYTWFTVMYKKKRLHHGTIIYHHYRLCRSQCQKMRYTDPKCKQNCFAKGCICYFHPWLPNKQIMLFSLQFLLLILKYACFPQCCRYN